MQLFYVTFPAKIILFYLIHLMKMEFPRIHVAHHINLTNMDQMLEENLRKTNDYLENLSKFLPRSLVNVSIRPTPTISLCVNRSLCYQSKIIKKPISQQLQTNYVYFYNYLKYRFHSID